MYILEKRICFLIMHARQWLSDRRSFDQLSFQAFFPVENFSTDLIVVEDDATLRLKRRIALLKTNE